MEKWNSIVNAPFENPKLYPSMTMIDEDISS